MIERLIDNFDLLATAPNGVTELRKMILQLAIQGKLVPQDPSDEPASILLEKIKAEKEKLLKDGKIKKTKLLSPIDTKNITFHIPTAWELCRVGDLGDWTAGTTPSRSNSAYYGGSTVWLKSGELRDNDNIVDSEEKITELALAECRLRICQPGDVLIALYGATTGKVGMLGTKATTNQAVCSCRCYLNDYNRYLFLFLKSVREDLIALSAGGAQPNISKEKVVNTIFLLPPLAEQKRIVAKIDQLMALCDELESKQQEYNEKRISVNSSCLHSLTTASNRTQPAAAQRIFNNFDKLYTHPQTVSELRKAILQLAVQGKLVPQDPNDEPAGMLFEKIKAEKEKLVKQGKIKNQKDLPIISEEEKTYIIPKTWICCRLNEIVTLLGDGIHGTPVYNSSGQYYFINGNNLNDGKIEIKNNTKTVSFDEFNKHKKDLNLSSILVSINGTIGNIAFYNGENVMLGKSACYFNLMEGINKYYIKILIQSNYFLEYAYSSATGTTIKNVSLKAMRELLVPLPPLAEQKRIVAKVDQLMNLCDNLEARLSQAQEDSESLAASMVYHLCDQVTIQEVTL